MFQSLIHVLTCAKLPSAAHVSVAIHTVGGMEFLPSLNSLPKDLQDLLNEDALNNGLVAVLEGLLSACRFLFPTYMD